MCVGVVFRIPDLELSVCGMSKGIEVEGCGTCEFRSSVPRNGGKWDDLLAQTDVSFGANQGNQKKHKDRGKGSTFICRKAHTPVAHRTDH